MHGGAVVARVTRPGEGWGRNDVVCPTALLRVRTKQYFFAG